MSGKKTLTTPKDLKLLVLLSWQKNSYNSKGFKITSFAVLAKNSYNLKAI
jgi:hypothetical protein